MNNFLSSNDDFVNNIIEDQDFLNIFQFGIEEAKLPKPIIPPPKLSASKKPSYLTHLIKPKPLRKGTTTADKAGPPKLYAFNRGDDKRSLRRGGKRGPPPELKPEIMPDHSHIPKDHNYVQKYEPVKEEVKMCFSEEGNVPVVRQIEIV